MNVSIDVFVVLAAARAFDGTKTPSLYARYISAIRAAVSALRPDPIIAACASAYGNWT